MNAADQQELQRTVTAMAETARSVARRLATTSTAQRNGALRAAATALDARRAQLLEANAVDVARVRERQLDAALIERLELDAGRVEAMLEGLLAVAALPDPVGAIRDLNSRPSGIRVGRMRMPLGVIAIIYESRPNVTADAASLCLKSGNACILRGGSEALQSNTVIADGLGAEIGISTDKLHARRPLGLEGLTSEKYVVFGEGQIRS